MENSLLTMLPDVYESMDVLGVCPTAGCEGGFANSEKCKGGQYFNSCSNGDCFKG